ncbi:MAG: M24 family metallopeptidase [Anaerolineales bacterium]|jgi:Xaa-Pro aminopeptidase|nr:M24 family metallopeptidase [Anaerolineales bacterium]|tara:strand:+ start:1801 stop:3060 length:1260 start_codon:yes stop_codon:yes gene_type:complete
MKSDLDRLMAERDLDALFVSGGVRDNPAMHYLANGAKVGEYTLLIKKRAAEPVLIAIGMERDEAAKSGLQVIERSRYDLPRLLKEESGNQLAAHARMLTAIFGELNVSGKVGLYGREEQGFTLALANELRARLPEITFIGEPTPNVLQLAQLTKDTDELMRIRALAATALGVVADTRQLLAAHAVEKGRLVTENGAPLTVGDVQRQIHRWSVERNLENPEGMIFASGRDAGVPHSRGQEDAPLSLGETIVFDYFPREAGGGYFYDFTRTWCLGHAPPVIEQAHEQVLAAFDLALSELRVGQSCRGLQRVVNDYFEGQGRRTTRTHPGTTEGYVHSLGHGVGLSVHEHPRLAETAAPEERVQAGMALTIEPGLYYPEDGFGIRVEDYVWLHPASGLPETIGVFDKELVIPLCASREESPS